MSEKSKNRTGDFRNSGFDRNDPNAGLIALLGAGMIVALVASVFGLQFYYDRVKEQQVYVKVLALESEDLRTLRAQENEQLHSYQYLDREKGQVRLPIERAMELLAKEYAEGKLPYSTVSYPVSDESE